MDIDRFISEFLDNTSREMEEFKHKYSKFQDEMSYLDWESLYNKWVGEKKFPTIILSDD